MALDKLKYFDFEPIEDFAKVDHHRSLRTGFPEVIWGPGKTPDQIVQIMMRLRQHSPVVMATRIEPEVSVQLQAQIPDLQYYQMARICAIAPAQLEPQYAGTIGLLSAGTADLAVAEEAAVTAELSGFRVTRLWDAGVAGIHRLLNNRQVIEQADVLIVVAGMEGALPSVVAGLANCPVIAVPTSIGYGASFNGLAPLLTMLNSCAAGIGVVNIDNGFGAAVLAGQILRTASRLSMKPET
jgi:NCAIR mutase (PurE)-related protein